MKEKKYLKAERTNSNHIQLLSLNATKMGCTERKNMSKEWTYIQMDYTAVDILVDLLKERKKIKDNSDIDEGLCTAIAITVKNGLKITGAGDEQ